MSKKEEEQIEVVSLTVRLVGRDVDRWHEYIERHKQFRPSRAQLAAALISLALRAPAERTTVDGKVGK